LDSRFPSKASTTVLELARDKDLLEDDNIFVKKDLGITTDRMQLMAAKRNMLHTVDGLSEIRDQRTG